MPDLACPQCDSEDVAIEARSGHVGSDVYRTTLTASCKCGWWRDVGGFVDAGGQESEHWGICEPEEEV